MNPTKNRCKLKCSGRLNSSCSTSGTRRVNLVTHPVITREWGKNREVFTTSGTYPWSFVTQIFHNGQPSHGGDRTIFEVMTSTLPKGTSGSVASLFSCYSIFSFICMFCGSLFVLLYFFFWPLCCLFFDIRFLIAPLVSSNSSSY
jgi:hypothetical protein